MHFADITHPDDVDESVALEQAAAHRRASRATSSRSATCSATGQVVWAQAHVSLVHDSNGQPAYAIGQVQDITERKHGEESIRESRRQLAEAQKLAQLGSWQWSLETGEVSWSEELYRDLRARSRDRTSRATRDSSSGCTRTSAEKVEAIVDRSLARREPFHEEMQIVRADERPPHHRCSRPGHARRGRQAGQDGRHRPGRDRAQDGGAQARPPGGGGEGAQGAQRLPLAHQPRAAHPSELDPRLRPADGDGRPRRRAARERRADHQGREPPAAS